MKRSVLMPLLGLCVMACGVVAPVAAAEPPRPLLALGVGDAVSVEVYGRPELTTTTYIADDGSIAVPLAGNVQVKGLSPSVAASAVAKAFKSRDLLVDPQVTLFLVESRSQQVSVLGAVRTPGRFVVASNTTVIDILALAGGIAEEGGNRVIVMRTDEDGQAHRHAVDLQGFGERDEDLPVLTLRGGDSIFVPEAGQFSIYGEVNSPNVYRLVPGMTVVEAITLGGGVTPRGSRNRVEIRRAKADGSFATGDRSLDEEVLPNDVIRVKTRWF